LFKFSMLILVVYGIYNDPLQEAQFSAVSSGLFILPFFLFSALAGQLADNFDKARISRLVKNIEILLAIVGGIGLIYENIPLMLTALFLLGLQSTFFGPIKYAILPQHLEKEEVLAGTGLVEAGTYIAILGGTILGGALIYATETVPGEYDPKLAAGAVLVVAIAGWISARQIPAAPPQMAREKIDYNVIRASYNLIRATMKNRTVFLAIIAISFFWTIGAVLIILFPPLVKNVLTADPSVATGVLGVFSIGIAIGSVLINLILKSKVSARFAPISVIAMGGFALLLYFLCLGWQGLPEGQLYDFWDFISFKHSWFIIAALAGIAITGGMFVVPLYAFLTTTVDISETGRTIAANNVVNSGCMVLGSLTASALGLMGVTTAGLLILVAGMCLFSAYLGWILHKACDDEPAMFLEKIDH
ncbi:MFS transporter, partial [Sphingorhabdus sp. Alg239-R122]|uniref:MFS transporter n=1 Tax=Sphingorhabdus sp. Alg239-R122 TaxID=2305989 RepID=UPI0013D98BB7